MLKKALLAVDLQNDFYEDGALGVPEASKINSYVNELLTSGDYDLIVASQDWHPPEHKSFAVNHDQEPFTPYSNGKGIGPVLWPSHCVQESKGADFHPDIETKYFDYILRKGTSPEVDSYSAFQENNGIDLGLAGLLKALGIEEVEICGLALDVCVLYTARDACHKGFKTTLIRKASKGVEAQEGDIENSLEEMKELGVEIK